MTDKGYFSGCEILACYEDGITTTLSRPETSGNRSKCMYVKADFAYDADADVYRCSRCKTLTYRYTTEEAGLVVRRFWTNVCQTCRGKARDTTGKERLIRVCEPQLPNGASMVSRFPRGTRPRRRGRFVFTALAIVIGPMADKDSP